MTLYHYQVEDRIVVSTESNLDDAQATGRWISVKYEGDSSDDDLGAAA